MADLEKGTEGKETVARSDAEGRANEASAVGAFASVSRESGESDEDGAPDDDHGQDRREVAAREQASSGKSRSRAPLLWGALAFGIAAGLGLGWLGHDFQVNQAKKNASAAVNPTGAGATGPCKAWADTICEQMGEVAYECTHARAARALLSDSACVQAQETVLAKIDAIKAERVQCNELTRKLCADLGPEGKGCELARAKEQTFSIQDCRDMTKSYSRVLAQITERQEKGTLPTPRPGPRNVTITKPN